MLAAWIPLHSPSCLQPTPPSLLRSAEHKALEQQLEESQREAAAQREAADGKDKEEKEEEAPQHLVHAAAALRDQLREAQAQVRVGCCSCEALLM